MRLAVSFTQKPQTTQIVELKKRGKTREMQTGAGKRGRGRETKLRSGGLQNLALESLGMILKAIGVHHHKEVKPTAPVLIITAARKFPKVMTQAQKMMKGDTKATSPERAETFSWSPSSWMERV